jgi:hypothetical protein
MENEEIQDGQYGLVRRTDSPIQVNVERVSRGVPHFVISAYRVHLRSKTGESKYVRASPEELGRLVNLFF